MLLNELNKNVKPVSVAYPIEETPHLSLETNFTCNLACRACYNMNKDHIKPFDQIRKEITFAVSKRNLETITVIGGEPTLHPDLTKTISFIRKQGIFCQLLTNGILFLEDDEDILLKDCIKAGVNRIFVHVDEGQIHYHKDIKGVIKKLFDKFEKNKIPFGLSVTIYNDTKDSFPELIRDYLGYRYYDGAVGYLVRDFSRDLVKKLPKSDYPELDEVYHSIVKDLRIEPSAYVPSSVRDDYISWMIFLFLINEKTGVSYGLSPGFIKFGRKLNRLWTGKNPVGGFYSRKTLRLSILAMFFLEVLMNFRSFGKYWSMMRGSAGLKHIRQLFITLQNPPEYDKENNIFHICYHCPDATVRNGKITPLCVADFISPIGKESELGLAFPEEKKIIRETVYKHLGEED